MSIFDDVVHGLEKVSKTVTETASEALDEFRSLPSTALGIVQEMRTVTTALPTGFPVVDILGAVTHKDVAGAVPGAITTLNGGAFDLARSFSDKALNPQPLPPVALFGNDMVRSLTDLITSQPSRALRTEDFSSLFNRNREVALNPQPLPPSPADYIQAMYLRNYMMQDHIQSLRSRSEIALNPQPLPPSPADYLSMRMRGNMMRDILSMRNRGEVALNPQPLPPSPVDILSSRNRGEVALNPQPLPPSPVDILSSRNRGEVALNPQPLPPSPVDILSSRNRGEGALNPQPLPPSPVDILSMLNRGAVLGNLATSGVQPESERLQMPLAVVKAPILQGGDLAKVLNRVNWV